MLVLPRSAERSGKQSWVHWRCQCPKCMRQRLGGPPNPCNFPSGLSLTGQRDKRSIRPPYGPGVQMDSHRVSVLADWDTLQ
jgi:hypothetical protein